MQKLSGRISEYEVQQTLRPVSVGAEMWLGRPIECLDHGYVYLVDYLGNDESVAEAARVSYGRGTKKTATNEGLIRYLLRHHHTTPFEMVEFKFHCKMPIFVARQWIRHRTASVNENSGRYSVMSNEFYVPDVDILAKQATENRQGRGENLTPEQKARVLELLREDYERTYTHYEEFIGEGFDLTRELARIGLSGANYTHWYWKMDLHNLMHFLKLRMDKHAQYEIRVYANALARIVKDVVPLVFGAFEDYQLNAMELSGPERRIIAAYDWPMAEDVVRGSIFARFGNQRETGEFIEKLKRLGLLK